MRIFNAFTFATAQTELHSAAVVELARVGEDELLAVVADEEVDRARALFCPPAPLGNCRCGGR